MKDPLNTPLEATWSALVYRAAALAGAVTGLVALLADVPVTVACMRGALTLATVFAVGYAAQRLMVGVAPARTDPVPGGEPSRPERTSTPQASESAGR
jgi:phage tail sheath gpL-like